MSEDCHCISLFISVPLISFSHPFPIRSLALLSVSIALICSRFFPMPLISYHFSSLALIPHLFSHFLALLSWLLILSFPQLPLICSSPLRSSVICSHFLSLFLSMPFSLTLISSSPLRSSRLLAGLFIAFIASPLLSVPLIFSLVCSHSLSSLSHFIADYSMHCDLYPCRWHCSGAEWTWGAVRPLAVRGLFCGSVVPAQNVIVKHVSFVPCRLVQWPSAIIAVFRWAVQRRGRVALTTRAGASTCNQAEDRVLRSELITK